MSDRRWAIYVCEVCSRAFEKPGARRHFTPAGEACAGVDETTLVEVVPAEEAQSA